MFPHDNVDWALLPWSALTLDTLYALMMLRQRVFVVEQTCAYLDADGRDPHCLHLLARRGDDLVACARLLPPGLAHAHACIGRVVTAAEVRRTGLGRELMRRAIDACEARGWRPIHLSGQAYLREFYTSLGFEVTGEGYLEDGIPHLPFDRA